MRVYLVAAAMIAIVTPAMASEAAHKSHGVGAATAPMAAVPPVTAQPHIAPYGSYCFTPLGRVGPVAAAPVGAPCTGPSAQGLIPGQMVQ